MSQQQKSVAAALKKRAMKLIKKSKIVTNEHLSQQLVLQAQRQTLRANRIYFNQ